MDGVSDELAAEREASTHTATKDGMFAAQKRMERLEAFCAKADPALWEKLGLPELMVGDEVEVSEKWKRRTGLRGIVKSVTASGDEMVYEVHSVVEEEGVEVGMTNVLRRHELNFLARKQQP